MPEPKRPLKVFLCHSSQDKPIVKELYNRLLNEGWIDPWLDKERLKLGDDFDLEIEKAIESTDAVIAFISENAVKKTGYIQKELRLVYDAQMYRPDGELFTIPLRLEECEPPHRFKYWHWGDYFGEEKEKTYQSLLNSLKFIHERVLKSEAAEKTRLEAEELKRQKKAAKEKTEREAKERAERERKEKELRENQVHDVSGKARNETERKDEKFATGKPKTKNKLLYGFGGFVALILCILLLSSLNKLLQNVVTTPENTLTQTNISSTTAVNPSATSIIKITSTPTDELPPNLILTLTLEPGCKDNAIFVADVTIPDGATVSPSQVFVKTWRIQNNGSCTWGEGYLTEHVAGEKMMGQALPLPNIVMPGESVDVSVRFTAPASTGKYTSDWQMVNVNGVKFGTSFFIKITVK